MSPTSALKYTSHQHQLSEFLYAELLHSMGTYRVAADKLEELHDNLGGQPAGAAAISGGGKDNLHEGRDLRITLHEVVSQALSYNARLSKELHHPIGKVDDAADGDERSRHPSPLKSRNETPDPELLKPILAFYTTTTEALRLHQGRIGRKEDQSDAGQLGRLLAYIHDPQRRSRLELDEKLVEDRAERMQNRYEEIGTLPGAKTLPTPNADGFASILHDHLDVTPQDDRSPPLHLSILKALSDAHKWMHEAEHCRSQPFNEMFTEIPATDARVENLLTRSIALNTFVYVAARRAPWIFAEHDEERAHVVKHYEECCESLSPTYCMWIASQFSLLALERRGYAWWTMGKHDFAYRDFYKLIRLLRHLRHQATQRAVRVPGTRTLIEGLSGLAEHHIGRIYRSQHAHRAALMYFDRASLHLKGWEEHAEIGPIVKNSRWRLHLLISQGKANYELGRVKRSMLYYARAWRAFLLLTESESQSTANIEVVMDVIKWLAEVENDPELNKVEVSQRLAPLVDQFETVYSPVHLRLLAADIMMRLGHLLFILKLPSADEDPDARSGPPEPPPDHGLARRCLFQAAFLDARSTLIAADLLRLQRSAKQRGEVLDLPATEDFGRQWASGSSHFEEAARVVEHILQIWLDEADPRAARGNSVRAKRARFARELVASFLAHTDSSNVRHAQVYRYLMHRPRDLVREAKPLSPTMDIVCLRRYSSFYAFLPRPAAFRAPGGGYLVQVRDHGDAEQFGIAIDPGPSFLDNLYRCGYSLADIHMIVLTHDHADHIASLDALLALMGARKGLGDETFGIDEPPKKHGDERLVIVGNASVKDRYDFFNEVQPVKKERDENTGTLVDKERSDAVRVMTFDRFHEISSKSGRGRRAAIKGAGILLRPTTLCIQPIRTIDHCDASGHLSQGFLLSIGEGASKSSALFTGDTGPQPRRSTGHYFAAQRESPTLKEAAAAADVVIAHISSAPLPELRELASLDPVSGRGRELARTFTKLWSQAAGQAEQQMRKKTPRRMVEPGFLLRQLQFGFRSRPAKRESDLKVSPLSPLKDIRPQSEKHLYVTGLLQLAEHMQRNRGSRHPLLLIGELREELGTFRTRIAARITEDVFKGGAQGTALTADIGLRLHLSRPDGKAGGLAPVSVLCSTCDLDNDLIARERFHPPQDIREVCVKGEDEGIFYNCPLHDPSKRPEQRWLEAVERYDPFGD